MIGLITIAIAHLLAIVAKGTSSAAAKGSEKSSKKGSGKKMKKTSKSRKTAPGKGKGKEADKTGGEKKDTVYKTKPQYQTPKTEQQKAMEALRRGEYAATKHYQKKPANTGYAVGKETKGTYKGNAKKAVSKAKDKAKKILGRWFIDYRSDDEKAKETLEEIVEREGEYDPTIDEYEEIKEEGMKHKFPKTSKTKWKFSGWLKKWLRNAYSNSVLVPDSLKQNHYTVRHLRKNPNTEKTLYIFVPGLGQTIGAKSLLGRQIIKRGDIVYHHNVKHGPLYGLLGIRPLEARAKSLYKGLEKLKRSEEHTSELQSH